MGKSIKSSCLSRKLLYYNLQQLPISLNRSMKKLFEYKYEKRSKVFNPFLLIVFNLLKVVFWLIFASLVLLQTTIFLVMWNDGIGEDFIKAVVLYLLFISGWLTGIFTKQKKMQYFFATCVIFLFLYLSSQPNLSHYFGYFDGLM